MGVGNNEGDGSSLWAFCDGFLKGGKVIAFLYYFILSINLNLTLKS